jgi:tetratricopeptide (TPR) repeat protein
MIFVPEFQLDRTVSLRRNLAQLKQSVTDAQTDRERAVALYDLALFQDNNGRETDAITKYRQALRLGLDNESRVCALAWLASSLFKTGQYAAAMRNSELALAEPCPPKLTRFLLGLQRRIRRKQTSDAV